MAKQERKILGAGLIDTSDRGFSEWDDYLIHQVPDMLDGMGYGRKEEEWNEHIWLAMVPPKEGLPMVASLWAIRPNETPTGYMHGFSMACFHDVQYNFKGCRPLAHDRGKTKIGPISLEYLEPLTRYRHSLLENPYSSLTFDVELERRADPEIFPTWEFQETGEPFVTQWTHTTHSLRATKGWIKAGGKNYDAKDYTAVTDHCWGIRGHKMGIFLHTWLYAFFPDFTFHLYYREDQDGKIIQNTGVIIPDGKKPEWTKEVKCEFAWEAGTRNFTKAEWTVIDASGKKRKVKAERLYSGLYWEGGWSGENPEEYRGPFRTDGDTWELTREKQLELGRQAKDQLCRFDFDGVKGMGIFESAVSKKHKIYGPQL